MEPRQSAHPLPSRQAIPFAWLAQLYRSVVSRSVDWAVPHFQRWDNGNSPSAHHLEVAKGRDQVEVGNQVWLFILFDSPAAMDQSAFLKIGP
jgi:hypothetical protein